MSELIKLGRLIGDAQAYRDAIHIAIVPVIADCDLSPNQRIRLASGCKDRVRPECAEKPAIGIVDPFLVRDVKEEERFYMLLMPNTITSLRHDWTHPAFQDETKMTAAESVAASEKWLREYVKRNCPYLESQSDDGYQEFMSHVLDNEIFYYGRDLHGYADLEEPTDELFKHLSVILGHYVGPGDFEYSCSC